MRKSICTGVFLVGSFASWTVHAQTIPNDAKPTCTVSDAQFDGWFESGTRSANGVVNPANSVAFPNSPNCSFYQWSKQMFLWLTSPAPATYGGGGGRIFDSPAFFDVSPPDAADQRTFIAHTPGLLRFFPVRAAQAGAHGLAVIMDKRGRMFEVQPLKLLPGKKPLVRNTAGALVSIEHATRAPDGKLVLLNKTGTPIKAALASRALELTHVTPPVAAAHSPAAGLLSARIARRVLIDRIPIFLDSAGNVIDTEEGQADGSALLAQNGSLIYYATIVNDVYAYFLTAVKDGAIPAGAKFPTTAADLSAITTFASGHGKTFPDPNALAVEVKSAWVETTGIANLGNYITMQATIPSYDKTNPNHWVANGRHSAQLALVGMHVVGSAQGHPEMIWATFEHFGNTPNSAYSYISAGGAVQTVPRDTTGTWLFSASGAVGANIARAASSGADIINAPGQTIGPTNILRMKPWGGAFNAAPNPLDPPTGAASTDASAVSNTDIIAINTSVGSKLPGGDIRSNYFMTGSTWTINGAASNGNFGNPGNNTTASGTAVGTSQIANTTMETFQQVSTSFDQFSNNCFSCHATNSTSVSHVFPTLKPLF